MDTALQTNKINWSAFPLRVNDLIFRPNILISVFIKIGMITQIPYKNSGCLINVSKPKTCCDSIKYKPIIKIVDDGVFSPMKSVVCLVSILNLASLNAAPKAIRKAGHAAYGSNSVKLRFSFK